MATALATALAPERAEELRRLVAAADLASFPEHPALPAGRPDKFVYRLTVEEEAGARSVSVGEDAAPEPLRRLIEWLQAAAEG